MRGGGRAPWKPAAAAAAAAAAAGVFPALCRSCVSIDVVYRKLVCFDQDCAQKSSN